MGANFSRVKTWVSTEDVVYSDLNAEFDNILNNLTAANVDDYSANVSQMQTVVDPGEVGSESLATSVAGEIARIRKLIAEITGEDEWYESPTASIIGLSNAIGTGLTNNRLVSGKVRSTSAQPIFLNANGAAKTVTVKGATTNFIYYVNGTEYTISTDVSLTGLTAAPSSNNTCLINDAVAAAQAWTKLAGEDGSEIPVDTMGSEISALVGKFAAFKIGAEYFIAYVDSTTRLTKARRGYFFDSSDAPIVRVSYSNNDTVTLMKLTWVFAKTDGTLTATYNNPVWSDDEPSSPALGDYWFDLSANVWKVYGVGSYATANAVLVGVCVQDATNTVAARSFEFFKAYGTLNTVELFSESNSQMKSRYPGSQISVWGTTIKNDHNLHTWDMTLDLESGVTESASTYYYAYITETGDKILSDKKPFDRREDLQGYYHPHHSWRCIGRAFNNGSSNLEQVESYYRSNNTSTIKALAATDYILNFDDIVSLSGASATYYLPPAALCKGRVMTFIHAGTSLTQVYTLDAYGSETIGDSTTYGLYTATEVLRIMSDGSNWAILFHKTVNTPVAWTPTGSWSTNTTYTGFWQREFNFAWIDVNIAVSGAPTSATLTVTIPTNMAIDTSVLTNSTQSVGTLEGVVGIWDTSASGKYGGRILYNDTTSIGFSIDVGNGAGTQSFITQAAPMTFAAGDVVNIKAKLPISGWKP